MSDHSEPVTSIRTPIELDYNFTAGEAQSKFLAGLTTGHLVGQRCPKCEKVYVPPRGACATCGVATEAEVELADKGTITTYCVVNIPFFGQKITPPYVCAQVLLDGSNLAFMGLVQECDANEVRMGMRVEAVWEPEETWGPSLTNIRHFRPSGEPDAPYESFKEYL